MAQGPQKLGLCQQGGLLHGAPDAHSHHACLLYTSAAEKRRRHLDTVEELKRRGFTDPTMRDWTFENYNGRNPQAGIARRYVEHWEDMRADNIGCLFWGGVGTGKSYLAGCIANALMEKEIPVHMTNFALILNDLAASFENRNEYISRLCRYPLLIIDDFGMERGTEYGLEQVFNEMCIRDSYMPAEPFQNRGASKKGQRGRTPCFWSGSVGLPFKRQSLPSSGTDAVSYTHLDVYKRQLHNRNSGGAFRVCSSSEWRKYSRLRRADSGYYPPNRHELDTNRK